MTIHTTLKNSMPEMVAIRRDLHEHPELGLEEVRTSDVIARHLEGYGYKVTRGLAKTGLVATLVNGTGRKSIGIRADIDALPIFEETGLPYASKTPGKMHACGHDGHTAMLLGAAKYLAETRSFSGNVAVIFQPAEEGGGGGNEMVKDGMMERFGIAEVYGMHNLPGMPVGSFGTRPGPIMAATDEFNITVKGRGGHAALPHKTVDPIVIGAQVVSALQTIVSRVADPIASLVVSVTKFNAGFAHNVIPETAQLAGTVRTLSAEMRQEA